MPTCFERICHSVSKLSERNPGTRVNVSTFYGWRTLLAHFETPITIHDEIGHSSTLTFTGSLLAESGFVCNQLLKPEKGPLKNLSIVKRGERIQKLRGNSSFLLLMLVLTNKHVKTYIVRFQFRSLPTRPTGPKQWTDSVLNVNRHDRHRPRIYIFQRGPLFSRFWTTVSRSIREWYMWNFKLNFNTTTNQNTKPQHEMRSNTSRASEFVTSESWKNVTHSWLGSIKTEIRKAPVTVRMNFPAFCLREL